MISLWACHQERLNPTKVITRNCTITATCALVYKDISSLIIWESAIGAGMPVKENLRTVIQTRRCARGLGPIRLSTVTDRKRKEQLTPEEEEKRRLRRERNKQAANRCRKRKRDKIEMLERTAQEIDDSNKALETDIANMRTELTELMSVLRSHDCVMRSRDVVTQEDRASGLVEEPGPC
ncbi:predicted protein [Nematostella vectensis]|uniref:BZIP domain-containing protein n=1 Tax=Nematostella vectensis TaxID=45351 RepID=A7SHQ5_NEMVE|nr:predicted protein [Nematostella vectensis]|eukprot:XP_001628839.1 predicted protein [Nematostella vectensis]